MPPVLIACPITNGLVPTGASADDPEELDDLPGENLLIACSDCGRDHEWTRQDAIVARG